MIRAHNFVDLAGQTFNRLTVINIAEKRGKRIFWLCRCSCGNLAKVASYHLKKNMIQSCGCLRKEHIGNLNRSHGQTKTPEYTVWHGMRARCNDANHHSYPRYGGRGITVCDQWNDFLIFLQDMGYRPSDKHSIERRDPNLGYSPENCYWATLEEQANNRSNNHVLTLNGKSQSIALWSRELHLSYTAIVRRVNLGWSDERALTEPLRKWPSQI
jgi:hypothetical protein